MEEADEDELAFPGCKVRVNPGASVQPVGRPSRLLPRAADDYRIDEVITKVKLMPNVPLLRHQISDIAKVWEEPEGGPVGTFAIRLVACLRLPCVKEER